MSSHKEQSKLKLKWKWNMEKIECPIWRKNISQHDEWQAYLCVEKFVKVATNPVAYGSVRKTVCPMCKKDMGDHNGEQTTECMNKFIKEVTSKSA